MNRRPDLPNSGHSPPRDRSGIDPELLRGPIPGRLPHGENCCPFLEPAILAFMHRILLAVFVFMTVSTTQGTAATSTLGLDELKQMTARFAPTPLEVNTSGLSTGDQKALVKLLQAARIVNRLFLQQLWSGNLALYQKLQQDKTPLGHARLHYFWINKSPWSEIDEHKAFLPDVPARKPPGANFYPEDMTKEEFESWVRTLSPESKAAAEGFFTVIRRDEKHKLKYVPYSTQYSKDL